MLSESMGAGTQLITLASEGPVTLHRPTPEGVGPPATWEEGSGGQRGTWRLDLGPARRMLWGRLPDTGPRAGSPRQDGPSSLTEPRAESPRKEACREDLRGCKPSPTSGRNPKGPPSYPGWGQHSPDQKELQSLTWPPVTSELRVPGSRPAPGPLAWLGRRRGGRLPFSRFWMRSPCWS